MLILDELIDGHDNSTDTPHWCPHRTTEAERREAAFQRHLSNEAEHDAAVEAAGYATPWWRDDTKLLALKRAGLNGLTDADDIDRRRDLFYRRWTRPDPPASIPARSWAEICRRG
ncbi:hypothetical protein [Mycolicibacter virginiensis]|uniref:hypothetical protein n=1 Tax=Mycolicibacter virginiensis TaxID=1795032 RepID=UPI00061B4896|nr:MULTISPECIES: hypothetical protein [Mycobacteriaceae]ULP48923.1 hypothetical protein MJO54_07575 [Mycolicibacter virginiensis]